jgi:hypothetical protein
MNPAHRFLSVHVRLTIASRYYDSTYRGVDLAEL